MEVALFVAMLGGILPALLWLAFWLLEDRCQPEPKRYIFFAFIAGMLAVLPTLYLERAVLPFLAGSMLLLAWAAIEEIMKFGAAYLGGLRSAAFDEPLDAVVYLVTAALGFSALENAFFLWTPIQQGDVLHTLVTGDLRFIGATLLHTLASATIGVCIALSFYKSASVRRFAAFGGVILATLLHTVFNFFILEKGNGSLFWAFLVVWVLIIALLLVVERIKQPERDYC